MKMYLAYAILTLAGAGLLAGLIVLIVHDWASMLFALGFTGFVVAVAWALVTVNSGAI